ncbi:HNH endonuclease [Rhodovulum sulfidophilum]|uniref:HNH endonuclease n=1 Tax=Rhodovulum sulfidophilum TaxID=35806 RepID=UPI0019205C0E|nr:HNH endonuclease [Rhodovulum sulfidophilum]MBL3565904.1 HNH endonuclease [Rhodovulum sulfidophilum]
MTRPPICPLCDRPIPPGTRQSLHHLTPKLRGGKGGPTVLLLQICHDAIHVRLTETDLARDFASIEALRAHPGLAKFLAWVARRPPGFHSRTPGPRRRR